MKTASDRYVKIYQTIFDSSIAENYELRHFFEDLLTLADWHTGIVDMTPGAIARRINLPEDKVRELLPLLEGQDPNDKSGVGRGERIVLLDDHRNWGWRIVNYEAYRAMRSAEDRREYNRLKQQESRARRASNGNGGAKPRKPRASGGIGRMMPLSGERAALEHGAPDPVLQEREIRAAEAVVGNSIREETSAKDHLAMNGEHTEPDDEGPQFE